MIPLLCLSLVLAPPPAAAIPPTFGGFRVVRLDPEEGPPFLTLALELGANGSLRDCRSEPFRPEEWEGLLRPTCHEDEGHRPCQIFVGLEKNTPAMRVALEAALQKLRRLADPNRQTVVFIETLGNSTR